jgi:hypothetical protein
MFQITVYSKAVGFMINRLRSYLCHSFTFYFHLWGFGGPNWQREYDSWLYEQDREWQTVSRRNPGIHCTRYNFPHRRPLHSHSSPARSGPVWVEKSRISRSSHAFSNFVQPSITAPPSSSHLPSHPPSPALHPIIHPPPPQPIPFFHPEKPISNASTPSTEFC